VTRLWRHMRALWPRWTLLPPAPFLLWCSWCLARGERRWELLVGPLLVVALSYGTATSKKLLISLYPIALVGVVYDAMRFTKNLGLSPENIHICDLRDLDARLFGVRHAGELLSLPDYFYAHHHPALDVLAAIPYGTFIYASIAYATMLFVRDSRAIQRFAWTFLLVNLLGFATYHLYPAAPPWYFHAYGCRADLFASASEGSSLARVDTWLGFRYFAAFYGRSNDVFGAMPSLHVAYPLLMALEGWRRHGRLGKALTGSFFLVMCWAAVYLDHHWVLDVVAGIACTLVVYSAVSWFFARRRTRESGTTVSGLP
jgi:inositol phosphorylceramide synthase catalytic subunit